MIVVEGLKKVYKSEKFEVTALDGVSFALPSNGLVFVVGKSGSGKSTLLNLLGGLDEATEGAIRFEGDEISEEERDPDIFRARCLGFIFQDFHLMEKLTVADNVSLALELNGKKDYDRVKKALRQVGLDGVEGRYPAELSGGQQQRVAIARAIVKEPKLILADEPTGNLDSVTSEQIIETLKDLSKDRLVVVVSHNLLSATRYADRIIELGDGRIVRDVTRVRGHEALVEGDTINLPSGELSDAQLDEINRAVSEGGKKLRRASEFVDTAKLETIDAENDMTADDGCAGEATNGNLSGAEATKSASDTDAEKDKKRVKRGLSAKRMIELGAKFTKRTSFVSTTVATAFVVALFAICVILYGFNGNGIYMQLDIARYGVFSLQKGYCPSEIEGNLLTDRQVRVTDEDIQEFEKAGYDGNVYKLYNMSIPVMVYSLDAGGLPSVDEVYRYFYTETAMGVLVADESYLKKLFGDFEVLAGDLYDKPYGVILTDYIADSIAFTQGTLEDERPYDNFVGKERVHERYYVNAVISTGYKKEFEPLAEKFKDAWKDGEVTERERDALTSSSEYADFLNAAQNKFNIAYSLNPDYVKSVAENPLESRMFARIMRAEIFDESGHKLADNFGGYVPLAERAGIEAHGDEAYMSLWLYNSLFGTQMTAEDMSAFEPKTLKLRDYDISDLALENVTYELTIRIKGVLDIDEAMIASRELIDKIHEYDVYAYALVFDSNGKMSDVLDVADRLGYRANAMEFSEVYNVLRVMRMYCDLFLTIGVVLLAVALLLMVAYGMKNVRGNAYEIGIIRALGAGKRDVATIFVVQTAFAALVISALATAGQAIIAALFDSILSAGLAGILHNNVFKNISLVTFNGAVAGIAIGAVFLITLASVILPLARLSRLRPADILKKKE